MKRIFISISCLITILFLLTSCGFNNKKTDKQQSDEMMNLVIQALENKNSQALKDLFSEYAKENTYDLDEKISELMEFYPGYEGEYTGNIRVHETTDRGVKIKAIHTPYKMKYGEIEYEISITFYVQNDVDKSKMGLYMIEVLEPEAEPNGFKWKDEEDEPGIYIWSE